MRCLVIETPRSGRCSSGDGCMPKQPRTAARTTSHLWRKHSGSRTASHAPFASTLVGVERSIPVSRCVPAFNSPRLFTLPWVHLTASRGHGAIQVHRTRTPAGKRFAHNLISSIAAVGVARRKRRDDQACFPCRPVILALLRLLRFSSRGAPRIAGPRRDGFDSRNAIRGPQVASDHLRLESARVRHELPVLLHGKNWPPREPRCRADR